MWKGGLGGPLAPSYSPRGTAIQLRSDDLIGRYESGHYENGRYGSPEGSSADFSPSPLFTAAPGSERQFARPPPLPHGIQQQQQRELSPKREMPTHARGAR